MRSPGGLPFGRASPPDQDGWRPELVVGFVFAREFTLTPFAGFVDALRLAADHEDDSRPIHCAWSFLSHDHKPLRASCGLVVLPSDQFGDPRRFDYVVAVGGRNGEIDNPPQPVLDFLRAAAAARIPLVGVCTGGFLLAQAGLMEGRRCCVHYSVQRALLRRFPSLIPVTDANFVIDGNIITCPGGVAAIDVATYLIKRHCSEVKARKAQNYLLTIPGEPRLHSPLRAYEDHLANASRLTVEAVRIMEMHAGRPFPVDRLAAMANATLSQLNRAFQADLNSSPAAFWRAMRLEQARHLLLDTSRSVTWIAYETGFADAAHFCKAFRAAYRTTPDAYRKLGR